MARSAAARERKPLPPPLPPDRRTVGQLVAETLRFYGSHFGRSLLLGVPPALVTVVSAELDRTARFVFVLTAGAALFTIGYIGACALMATARVERRALAVAFVAGFLVYLPVPFLAFGFVLPALAWLALVGLVVPVAVIEGLGFRGSFVRATQLARADYIHALGGLATLVIAYFLTRLMLFFLLQSAGESTERVAAFLADLVLSPILFVGSVLLYYDQAARAALGSGGRSTRRRNADVRDADQADDTGRPDAAFQS